MANVEFTVKMVVVECASCNIAFGLPGRFQDDRRNDHKIFYCPNGHSNSYSAKSHTERLLEQAKAEALATQAKLNDERHRALVLERQLDAETKKRRTLEKRVAKGVCPCCNRTFEDLARHMSSKHKDYALEGSGSLKALPAKKEE